VKFDGQLNNKLPNIGQSIFTTMSMLAKENHAINLAQGFPDFDCHPDLKKMFQDAIQQGHNQYAPMPGLMSLREKIAEKTEQLYSAIYHPETEITIVPGATLGIYAAINALIKDNDEVLVIEPAYDCYIPAIELAGGKAIVYEMLYPEFKIDWHQLRKFISVRTKMIIINSPNNPSGAILTAEDLQKLEKMIAGTDILVLSDEVYEHIIFDGFEHQSVARFPALSNRSIIVSSFGKTFHTTGWKTGYLLAPENITSLIRKAYQFMAFASNTPVQFAYSQILDRKDLYLELGSFYQEKRDFMRKGLKSTNFKLLDCYGSYFQLVNYDKISDLGDLEFSKLLTIENKIATIPVSAFYKKKNDNHILRLCFAKNIETIEKSLEILCKI